MVAEKLIYDFVALFVVLDPIGMIAVFIAIAPTLSQSERKKAAILSVIYAFAVLLFFIIAGELLLIQMGIPLLAFQVAGGLLLLLYGVEMSLGARAPGTSFSEGARQSAHALAVYPLAIPGIAGPGAMLTVVLLTDNREFGFIEQALTVGMLALVLLIFLLLLLAANPIMRFIGEGGANVLRRIMGVLLTAVAAKMVLTAFQVWLQLPPLT